MDIILDFGNVLINLDFAKTEKLLAKHLKPEVNHAFHTEKAATFFYQYETGHITTDAFLEALAGHCHKDVTKETLLTAWNALLLDIPKKRLDVLEQLRTQGHRVFLLSNTNEAHIRYVQEYLKNTYQISDFETRFFDKVFYSYEIKLRKPDIAIYQYVEKEIGLQRPMVFYDDNALNIKKAQETGWNAVLHDPKDEITTILQNLTAT